MSVPIPAAPGAANTTPLFEQLPRGEFIQRNLGLARSCAGRFTGRGIDYEDLYAAGCLGLVKACDGFDPARGVCFSTYAVPVILGEIKKLFRDGGTVKVSRSLKELGLKINAERERCLKKDGVEPNVTQLAETLGAKPEQVAMAIHASMPVVSLTPSEGEDGNREWDIPVDSPEEKVSAARTGQAADPASLLCGENAKPDGRGAAYHPGADFPQRAQDFTLDAHRTDRGLTKTAEKYVFLGVLTVRAGPD